MKNKTIVLIYAASIITLTSGCMQSYYNQSDKRTKEYEMRMTPEWIKQNITIGKTTESEVKSLYGKPLNETSFNGTGAQSDVMPDKIVTYAVRFTEYSNNWQGSYASRRTTRSLVFSFRNGVVINYTTSNN